MKKDIYKQLAEHLDDLPAGFPPTESGVELRILRRLFTPEEAELATKLLLIPEEAHVIAHRAKLPVEEVAPRLESMAYKGLIYSIVRDGKPTKYSANQFIIGIWEYHVNDLDPELIRDVNEYIPEFIDWDVWKKVPQLWTIPVNQSLQADLKVLPYENAVEILEKHEKFLEAPCICRKERRIMGQGCDKSEGNCLVLGRGAEYYERNGIGRRIDKEEALAILKRADEEGLVLQPSFSKKVANICCCCGCCCQILLNLKRHAEPAAMVSAPFIATLDQEACIGCGVCESRCQMDALHIHDDKAVLDEKKCIGCGLCVSTCLSGALTLTRKPDDQQPDVPDNLAKASIKRGQARGKFGPTKIVSIVTRNQVSKVLAKSGKKEKNA